MEARQQQIADLARHVLPFVEAHEQKEKFIKVTYQLLLLILTAVIAFSSAQYMRPISYAEERSLSMLIEYAAMKKKVTVEAERQQFLHNLNVRRLADIRAYQWDDALYRLTMETSP